MSETTLIVLGAIGFLAAGIGLGFWFSQLRLRGKSARADEIQQQFDDYRHEVTQHFGQTAEHFKAIGREYRELYEHMAGGADSLKTSPPKRSRSRVTSRSLPSPRKNLSRR